MFMCHILAAILLGGSAVAVPQTTAPAPGLVELAGKSREARLAGDKGVWLENGRAALALAPDHPDLLVSASRAFAANGRGDEALDLLEQAVGRGARVDAASLPEFEPLRGYARYRAAAAKGLENLRPVSPPEEFLVIEDLAIDTEGITWDEESGRLFIGSLKGGIWQVDAAKKIKPFAGTESGLREVIGLKIDARRRLLWAATAVFPDLFGGEPKKDVGLSGVIAFRLDDGSRASECWLDERPVQHGFNDLAIGANGDVYVSDSPTGSVYRLPGGECRFEKVVQDARMSFPNGIALSPDGNLLYVGHIEGLSVVELASGTRRQMPAPSDAALGSIDGLVRDGADLIALQPSPYLVRVARIRLDDAGTAVREVAVISSPWPEGVSPTTGVVAGTHYYSVAGVIDPEAPDRRARILRSRLR